MKENKVPAIRFQGFADDWEQRKLGDLGKARSGIGFPDAEQGGKEGVPFYKVSDMNNAGNEHEMVTANNYVTREQIVRKGWKPIDELPAIFFAKVGAAIMLNRKRLCRTPFLLDNNTMAYSMDGSVLDGYFAKTLFETIDLTSLVQVGALPSYNSGDVENIDSVIPEMNEQKAIGSYFKSLDHLIALHQRKMTKLQLLKKSMLTKMFPKDGARVPEIRFQGFHGDWEQRKVSDICSISTGKSNTQDKEDDGIYPFYVRSPIIEHSNKYLYDEEAVLTVGDGVGTGKVFHYVNGKYDLHQRVYRMYGFSDNISAKFFYQYFSKEFYNRVMAMTAKTSVDSVRYKMIADMDIQLPSKAEQDKIAKFLFSLDGLISLHQRKLSKLQQIKQAMLSKLFV
ncbi:restriction endonuclease subunit S [Selenomonas sp.]|jgi:type I restriction enzyme, S subunit|uniref:restriction endonuclease subunit S n=1 Tax=Selenomonas sp. TaxID=2053611 RepID=UPI003A101209